jgi:hypothetical protein
MVYNEANNSGTPFRSSAVLGPKVQMIFCLHNDGFLCMNAPLMKIEGDLALGGL